MKTCGKCGLDKDVEQFAWRDKVKGKRTVWCRSCARAYDKARYSNPEYRASVRARSVAARQRAIAFIADYRRTHPCVDCGNDDPRVLDFDHLQDKAFNIADMAGRGLSISRIEDEIAKCEVRCANCHRIVTHERRNGV